MTAAKPKSRSRRPQEIVVKLKRGRPSKFKPEMVEQARKLCELGATDAELADFFKVTIPTFYGWMLQQPEFFKVVTATKDGFDARIERSMAQTAMGYSYRGEKVFNNGGQVVRAETIIHVPADPGAQMNWLKNRKRADWQDGQVVEHKLPSPSEIAKAMKEIDGEV